MKKNNTNNTAEDGQQQRQSLQLQQSRRQQGPNLPAARPYRRRIKPPSKVHRIHAARFRRFVQSRTCLLPDPEIDAAAAAAPASTVDATDPAPAPVPADQLAMACGSGGGDQPAASVAPIFVDSPSVRSMQEAYMAWCSWNDIPLSPGTMAELSVTMHQSSNAAIDATSNTSSADLASPDMGGIMNSTQHTQ